eukprot:1157302-Pelagomonas_calceolata.AAC.8
MPALEMHETFEQAQHGTQTIVRKSIYEEVKTKQLVPQISGEYYTLSLNLADWMLALTARALTYVSKGCYTGSKAAQKHIARTSIFSSWMAFSLTAHEQHFHENKGGSKRVCPSLVVIESSNLLSEVTLSIPKSYYLQCATYSLRHASLGAKTVLQQTFVKKRLGRSTVSEVGIVEGSEGGAGNATSGCM